jgi:hypothetical protein
MENKSVYMKDNILIPGLQYLGSHPSLITTTTTTTRTILISVSHAFNFNAIQQHSERLSQSWLSKGKTRSLRQS